MLRLKKLLDSHLTPSETYLDLSSRNAQYFYLNRKSPIRISAAYNLVGTAEQQRAIAKLEKTPVKIALLSGDNLLHDGGKMALRTPLLYQFILMHYVPTKEAGFIISQWQPDTLLSEQQKQLFQQALGASDLKRIAISWGQSKKSLNTKMHRVARLIPHATKSGSVEFDLSTLKLAGKSANILQFDFNCISQHAEPELQAMWWSQGSRKPSTLRFMAHNGSLIAPLYASAYWQLASHLNKLQLKLLNPAACQQVRINNVELMQRNK